MTTRRVYQRELSDLDQQVLDMGKALEKSIDAAADALKNMNADAARNIMKDDDIIDSIERTIEKECIELIAKQAPIATDLRKICSKVLFSKILILMANWVIISVARFSEMMWLSFL